MNLIRKSAVALASVAALSIGATNTAYADAYAYANLNILGLTMADADGNVLIAGVDVVIPDGINDTEVNTSNLYGTPVQTEDSSLACLGDCGGIADDDFTTQDNTLTFSRTDSLIDGTIVDIPPGVIPELPAGSTGGVDAYSVSEISLTTANNGGNGQSTVQTNTEFYFTPNSDTQVNFSFMSSGMLMASLSPDSNTPPANASASSVFTISIREVNSGATVFTWSPDGGVFDGTTFIETKDNIGLTNTAAATSAGQTTQVSFANGEFDVTTRNSLVAGTDYTLSINHQTTVVAVRDVDVPEPDMLFLLGLGLAGFAVRKRQNNLK